ncbi:MAG: LysR family transcriptional regulator [Hyphomicrobiales bacterium]|nr:MAG: LysR family transcriptional regulator [Hyphomicrobiales bacterium]
MIMKMDHRLQRLKFGDLALIIAIAQTGSLRSAARRVGRSQPGLSKALKEIEDAFETPLYTRSRTGLIPTAAGLRVIPEAELMLAELVNIRAAAHATQIPALRIGCTPFMALVLMPRLLKAMPGAQVVLTEGAVPELLDALGRGRLDAVLANYPDADVASDAFGFTPLFREPLLIVSARGHRLGRSWAALSRASWVLPPRNSVIRRAIDARFLAEGLRPPVAQIESVNLGTNIRLIAAGLTVGAIPKSALSLDSSNRQLRVVGVAPQPEIPPLSLVYRKSAERHPRLAPLRAALDTLKALT